jgi:16S rRNA (guanine527-N7)-methyltransferase
MKDILAEGLSLLNIDPAALPLLVKYIEEIERFNPAYGLVKVQDRRELVVKHILDSLAPLDIISRLLKAAPEGPPGTDRLPAVADVGSGAGLPGIPLAICLPGARFTLIERMGRRAGFLQNCLAALGLANVRVEETEMEKAAPCRFGLVVFRAFSPLEKAVLKGLGRLLVPGGIIAAYKGRRQVVEAELAAAGDIPPESAGAWEIIPLQVPFLDEERHLAVLRQTGGVPGRGGKA